MGRAVHSSLTLRLGIALCLATAVILIVAGFGNLRLQRAHLTRLVVANATERADDIRRSTREAMMRNSPGEVRRIIEAIANQPTIERIRVYDKKGRITVSSDGEEVGDLVDKVAEQCVLCHRQDEALARPQEEDRTRIFDNPDAQRVLGVVAPIRNEPGCISAACHAHPASQTILGVLDVQLSLREVDKNLATSLRQMILGLIGTAVGVLALAWLLTWRMVLKPVGRLTEAARTVAEGDPSIHVPVDSADEIGEMTAAWNAMITKLGRAQNILERWNKTLEQRVRDKTAELEQAHQQMLRVERMASLGKLSAVVAHEINNPLAGINTYAHLLRRRLARSPTSEGEGHEPQDRDTERILKLIEEEAGRCGNIVRNLLLFSRTPGVAFTSQSLGPLLERCRMLLQHQADLSGVRLSIEAAPDTPQIHCDPSQVQQMILALALNGMEATPEGGSLTISVSRAKDQDSLILQVRDTGKGIAQEDLGRIFEPFFTTKDEGSGVGLGLAVVYGIVNRHGGTIDVDSCPEEGTAFTIRLPIHPPEADEGRYSDPAQDLEEVAP